METTKKVERMVCTRIKLLCVNTIRERKDVLQSKHTTFSFPQAISERTRVRGLASELLSIWKVWDGRGRTT